MQALNRNLIALALGAALVSPVALAQQDKTKTGTTGAGQATSESVRTGDTPASPTLPTQASPTASDAISERTDAEESGTEADATATTSQPTDTANAGATTLKSSASAAQDSMNSNASTNPGKGNWWADADTDGDGKLSTEEANANAGLSSRFSTIDADKDGFVTSEEYRVFYTANAGQGAQNAAAHSAVVTRDVWVKLDADSDSRISMAEAAGNADLSASFSTMDSNGDGFVTQAEYSAFSKQK